STDHVEHDTPAVAAQVRTVRLEKAILVVWQAGIATGGEHTRLVRGLLGEESNEGNQPQILHPDRPDLPSAPRLDRRAGRRRFGPESPAAGAASCARASAPPMGVTLGRVGRSK